MNRTNIMAEWGVMRYVLHGLEAHATLLVVFDGGLFEDA